MERIQSFSRQEFFAGRRSGVAPTNERGRDTSPDKQRRRRLHDVLCVVEKKISPLFPLARQGLFVIDVYASKEKTGQPGRTRASANGLLRREGRKEPFFSSNYFLSESRTGRANLLNVRAQFSNPQKQDFYDADARRRVLNVEFRPTPK